MKLVPGMVTCAWTPSSPEGEPGESLGIQSQRMRIVHQRKASAIQGDRDSKKQHLGMSTWWSWAQAWVLVSSISKLKEGGSGTGLPQCWRLLKLTTAHWGALQHSFCFGEVWKYLEWGGLEGVSCGLPQSDQLMPVLVNTVEELGSFLASVNLETYHLCVDGHVCAGDWGVQRIITKERSPVWESEADTCER